MAAQRRGPAKSRAPIGDSALAQRLATEVEGEVLFDAGSRGRYSTDASHYQIEPIGVVVPRTTADIARVIGVAADEGLPVLPRGAGTSQCGQTVGEAVVVDVSKHLNRVLELDTDARTAWVEPGLVLDQLNAHLKPHGLWFPVDVSTSSRATIGGMAGNNSCGARSIRYGPMRDNVRAIDGVLMDGEAMRFGELSDNVAGAALTPRRQTLVSGLLDLGRREATEIMARFPDVMRRVGGYNIDALMPGGTRRGTWADATVGRRDDNNTADVATFSSQLDKANAHIEITSLSVPTRETKCEIIAGDSPSEAAVNLALKLSKLI